jgi:hypothetical protein
MRRTIDATGLLDSTQVATDAAWRRRDIGDTIKAIDALVASAVAAEREACAKRIPIEPTEAMLDAARDWSANKYGKAIGNENNS